jgi:protein arginine kinase activator
MSESEEMPPQPPKCSKCGAPATHKITKIVHGEAKEILLCDTHAEEVSPYLKPQKPVDQSHLLQMLQKLQEHMMSASVGGEGNAEEQVAEGPVCGNCGLLYSAYRKTLLLGCSECYESFQNLLENDLRKIHGAISQIPGQRRKGSKIPLDTAAEAAAPIKPVVEVLPKPEPVKELTLEDTVSRMKKALEEAIEKEDFQLAAQLRDSIRALAGQLREAMDDEAQGESNESPDNL